jgi:hypothetical protein
MRDSEPTIPCLPWFVLDAQLSTEELKLADTRRSTDPPDGCVSPGGSPRPLDKTTGTSNPTDGATPGVDQWPDQDTLVDVW